MFSDMFLVGVVVGLVLGAPTYAVLFLRVLPAAAHHLDLRAVRGRTP